jgi:toxin ParE1/3/4
MGLVRRTQTSRHDYAAIWDYVAEHGSPEIADTLLRAFDDRVQFLSDFPGAGQARPELRARLRSFPVGPYLIFYRPSRGGIELVRVLHGARDIEAIFRRRRRK